MSLYVPVAVGRMLGSGELVGETIMDNYRSIPKKGKALQVDHYLFDELWKLGPMKMPKGVNIVAEEVEEDGQQGDEKDEEEEEKETAPEMSEAEWDERVVESFKRAIVEVVTPEDLPMEPSDF